MGRKRKLHLGNKPIGGAPVKSRRLARTITSKYHVIQNEKKLVVHDASLTENEKKDKLAALEHEMEKMGGTNKYQQASIVSTQHFKTSKWVAGTLAKLGKQTNSSNKLNVLEVGAINTQLQQYNWMDVRSIDLNSQHPSIEECDFFEVVPEQRYDVVVCSMVLNCVDDVVRRGEMLARLSCQLVAETGILFFVLPRRCVNSHHVGGVAHFTSLLNGLGLFELLPMRETPKLYFFILGNKIADKESTQPAVDIPQSNILKGTDKVQNGNCGSKSVAEGAVENIVPSVVSGNESTQDAWKAVARAQIAQHMSLATYRHFSRDFTAVPANQFAIALPSELTAGLFTE